MVRYASVYHTPHASLNLANAVLKGMSKLTDFSLDLIRQARAYLSDKVVQTPLLSSPMLDELVGAKVLVKAECLQKTGAFKFRGALFKMSTLSPLELSKGVITYSAGNHGQAVAAAARSLGCPAVIVMPRHAPQIKQDNCRWWGAEVVLYDKDTEDREAVAQALIDKRGLVFISPFDEPHIMAGQGTVGLEICDQLRALGHTADSIWVGCSGGGLASGVITALTSEFVGVESVLVEAEGYNKWETSLSQNQPIKLSQLPGTLMDGIAGPAVGRLPFDALKKLAPTTRVATENDAIAGVQAAFRYLKLVAEPGAAAALGALIRERDKYQGTTAVVVCSGGNVDPGVFARILSA